MVGKMGKIENDCYFNENFNKLILGNSKIEITLDKKTGCINRILNKTRGIEYLRKGKGMYESFRIVYSSWPCHGAAKKDIWSAVHGTVVNSSMQKISKHSFTKSGKGSRLEISYNNLNLEKRKINVSLRFTVELISGKEETIWRIFIKNNDDGTVREVHFPLISGFKEFDWLIMPNHGGERISDPVSKLSDETPVVRLEYPARASMQWFDYYSPAAGIYMASYDKNLEYTDFYFGRVGNEKNKVGLWIVKYPFLASDESWESPEYCVGIHSGDWHWGADRYREWLEGWVLKPKVSKWVAEMTDMRELTIKNTNEEVVNTYDDVVRAAKEMSEKPCNLTIMLVGWFYNGHDTYYPEYIPIPDLGGVQAFVDAVNKTRSLGIGVSVYINGRLGCVGTDTYKKYGKKWAVLGKTPGLGVNTCDFFELHENWNAEWGKSQVGEGWFSVMCPSVKEWQDHIVSQTTRVIKDYSVDGIFFDQPGSYYAELCYNKNHGHKNPAAAWGPGYLEIFRRIREETRRINPDSFLYTEGMNDVYGQYLDFHTDKLPLWEPMKTHPEAETFVEMWRYTLPWYITMGGSYSYPPSKDRIYGLNYLFVMCLRPIAYRLEEDLTNEEKHMVNAIMKKIRTLWLKGKEFFFYGRYLDDIGLKISNNKIFGKVYLNEGGILVAMWNTSNKTATCTVSINLLRLGKTKTRVVKIESLSTNKLLSYEREQDTIKAKIRINARDIDALIIRTQNQ
jgi:hypothetical protein